MRQAGCRDPRRHRPDDRRAVGRAPTRCGPDRAGSPGWCRSASASATPCSGSRWWPSSSASPPGFTDAVVVVIEICLLVGSLVLAPAIVFGYAVKAAERDDREHGR